MHAAPHRCTGIPHSPSTQATPLLLPDILGRGPGSPDPLRQLVAHSNTERASRLGQVNRRAHKTCVYGYLEVSACGMAPEEVGMPLIYRLMEVDSGHRLSVGTARCRYCPLLARHHHPHPRRMGALYRTHTTLSTMFSAWPALPNRAGTLGARCGYQPRVPRRYRAEWSVHVGQNPVLSFGCGIRVQRSGASR